LCGVILLQPLHKLADREGAGRKLERQLARADNPTWSVAVTRSVCGPIDNREVDSPLTGCTRAPSSSRDVADSETRSSARAVASARRPDHGGGREDRHGRRRGIEHRSCPELFENQMLPCRSAAMPNGRDVRATGGLKASHRARPWARVRRKVSSAGSYRSRRLPSVRLSKRNNARRR
jgi:hypothetical protein